MALFQPTLPSADDWARDPAGSWGRLWQAGNYSIDLYNATKAQIPVLQQRIDGFRAQLAQFPDTPDRAALLDQISAHETAVNALVSQQSGLEGNVLDALSQVRNLGQQLGQLAQSTGLGQVQIGVVIAVLGVAGLVVAAVFQFAANYQARKAESESIPAKILQFAQAHNLSSAQIAQIGDSLSKFPKPAGTGGLFDSLSGAVPVILGILAVVFLGPPLLKALGARMGRGSE